MSGRSRRNFGQLLNTWLQILILLIFGLWIFFQFIYKEFFIELTETAKVNLSIDISKSGTRKIARVMQAVNITVTATNPGNTKITLLPSVFYIYGIKVNPLKKSIQRKSTSKRLKKNKTVAITPVPKKPIVVQTQEPVNYLNGLKSRYTLIATGKIFSKLSGFDQGQKLSHQFIFYVAKDQYDALKVVTVLPVMKQNLNLKAKWQFNNQEPTLELQRPINDPSNDKDYEILDTDNKENILFLKNAGYYKATINTVFSLW